MYVYIYIYIYIYMYSGVSPWHACRGAGSFGVVSCSDAEAV